MRLKVDVESDTLYLRLSEDPIDSSEEVSPGIIPDFSKEGKVVGVEVLNLKERFRPEELASVRVEVPTTTGK